MVIQNAYKTRCDEIGEDIKNIERYVILKVVDTKWMDHIDSMDSLKNDIKSIKLILYKLIKNYGAPKYITFHNFYKTIPTEILNILEKYNINILSFKGIYRKRLA